MPYNKKASYYHYILNPRTDWMFQEVAGISFKDKNLENVRYTGLMFGTDIDFMYKGHNFRWWSQSESNEGDIYLMTSEWNYIKRPDAPTGTDDELIAYYCFKVDPFNGVDTPQTFEMELQRLISEYQNAKTETNE